MTPTPDPALAARLAPCPFCGSEPKLYLGRGAYGVKCTCAGKAFIHTYGGAVPADNSSEARATARGKAIAAWNTRSGQLITLSDHTAAVQAAVAKAVEAERTECAALCNMRGLEEQRNFWLTRATQNYFRARDAIRARKVDAL